ncbi:MAG: ABC transporter substrate-binding protein [Polyangia bacterium]
MTTRATRPSLAVMLLAASAPACFSAGETTGCVEAPEQTGPCSCDEATYAAPEGSFDGESEPIRRGGSLAVRIASEPGPLLSMITPDPLAAAIADHEVLETLVARAPGAGELVPELAESWQSFEDGRRWVFHLHPEARWHDGEPLTASDVEFTLERALDPARGAVLRDELIEVTGIEAEGDRAVVLHLARPDPGLLAALARLPILPAHVFGHDPLSGHPAAREPVGSGPFRIAGRTPGRSIELERNPDWRGEPPPLERISYRVVPDPRVATELLRAGTIDVVPDARPTAIRKILEAELLAVPLERFEAWVYETSSPPLDDPDVRKAIGHLIDRRTIRCSILACLAEIVEGPWPADSPAAIPSRGPLENDPALARELLERSGWIDSDGDGVRERGDVELAFDLMLPDAGREWRRQALLVQHDLSRAGIEMSLVISTWSAYWSRLVRHDFDVAVVSFENRRPFDPRSLLHSEAAASGLNFGSVSDPELDRLLDARREVGEKPGIVDLDRAISDRIAELHPMTFTFRPYRAFGVRRALRGVRFRGGWIDESRTWIAGPEGGGVR